MRWIFLATTISKSPLSPIALALCEVVFECVAPVGHGRDGGDFLEVGVFKDAVCGSVSRQLVALSVSMCGLQAYGAESEREQKMGLPDSTDVTSFNCSNVGSNGQRILCSSITQGGKQLHLLEACDFK
jgi:hypothetical protein